MIRGGITIIALLLALSLPALLNAQTAGQKLKKKFYRSTGIDINADACDKQIDKQLLLGKDFQSLVVTLEPFEGKITLSNYKASRVLQLVTFEGSYLILDEKGHRMENVFIDVLDNYPIMRFRKGKEDCFYYLVNF